MKRCELKNVFSDKFRKYFERQNPFLKYLNSSKDEGELSNVTEKDIENLIKCMNESIMTVTVTVTVTMIAIVRTPSWIRSKFNSHEICILSICH